MSTPGSNTGSALKKTRRNRNRGVSLIRRAHPLTTAFLLGIALVASLQLAFILKFDDGGTGGHPFFFEERFRQLIEKIAADSESLKYLLDQLATMTTTKGDDEIIDRAVESERCARYNWTLAPETTARRRLFRASAIAEDSWHAIAITAMEAFNVYHHVAFVESNRTHSFAPRKWRFRPNSEELSLLRLIFGPQTTVTVTYHVNEQRTSPALFENLQRDVLLRQWRDQGGMTTKDVGIFSDADESFTYDFLRALQICDVPQFRVGQQSCESPKIVASSIVFEGSPLCLTTSRRWPNPQVMLGECIQSIGDEQIHPRLSYDKRDGSGRRTNYYEKNNNSEFPLWNAADFRRTSNGARDGGQQVIGVTRRENTGFHLHNFFESEEALRFKYKTYSHAMGEQAEKLHLSELHDDIQMMIKCAQNISDEGDRRQRNRNDLDKNRRIILPRALRLKAYRQGRHEELKRMVQRALQ